MVGSLGGGGGGAVPKPPKGARREQSEPHGCGPFGMRSIRCREERVVVKLGARRAASLTQRATAWSMRDAVHYVRMRFMRVVIHEWCSPYVWADIMLG